MPERDAGTEVSGDESIGFRDPKFMSLWLLAPGIHPSRSGRKSQPPALLTLTSEISTPAAGGNRPKLHYEVPG